MASVPPEAWEDVVGFYRSLIDEHGWRQEPMLEFASWLASSDYGRILFPSTSHEALGLATVATFQERLQLPMVCVLYSDQEERFVLHYQRGQGHDVSRETVVSPQAPEVLARILDWLSVGEPIRARLS